MAAKEVARKQSTRMSIRGFAKSFRRSSQAPERAPAPTVAEAAPSPLTPEFCALPEMPENPEGVILDNRHPMRLTYGEKVPLRTSPDGDEATTSVVEFYCGVQPRPKRDGGSALRVPNIYAGRTFIVEPRHVVGRVGVLSVVRLPGDCGDATRNDKSLVGASIFLLPDPGRQQSGLPNLPKERDILTTFDLAAFSEKLDERADVTSPGCRAWLMNPVKAWKVAPARVIVSRPPSATTRDDGAAAAPASAPDALTSEKAAVELQRFVVRDSARDLNALATSAQSQAPAPTMPAQIAEEPAVAEAAAEPREPPSDDESLELGPVTFRTFERLSAPTKPAEKVKPADAPPPEPAAADDDDDEDLGPVTFGCFSKIHTSETFRANKASQERIAAELVAQRDARARADELAAHFGDWEDSDGDGEDAEPVRFEHFRRLSARARASMDAKAAALAREAAEAEERRKRDAALAAHFGDWEDSDDESSLAEPVTFATFQSLSTRELVGTSDVSKPAADACRVSLLLMRRATDRANEETAARDASRRLSVAAAEAARVADFLRLKQERDEDLDRVAANEAALDAKRALRAAPAAPPDTRGSMVAQAPAINDLDDGWASDEDLDAARRSDAGDDDDGAPYDDARASMVTQGRRMSAAALASLQLAERFAKEAADEEARASKVRRASQAAEQAEALAQLRAERAAAAAREAAAAAAAADPTNRRISRAAAEAARVAELVNRRQEEVESAKAAAAEAARVFEMLDRAAEDDERRRAEESRRAADALSTRLGSPTPKPPGKKKSPAAEKKSRWGGQPVEAAGPAKSKRVLAAEKGKRDRERARELKRVAIAKRKADHLAAAKRREDMARRAERDRQAAAELAAKKKAEIVEKERAKAAAAKKRADDQRAAARAAAEAESARVFSAAIVAKAFAAAAADRVTLLEASPEAALDRERRRWREARAHAADGAVAAAHRAARAAAAALEAVAARRVPLLDGDFDLLDGFQRAGGADAALAAFAEDLGGPAKDYVLPSITKHGDLMVVGARHRPPRGFRVRCDKDAALVYAYLDAAARDYPRPATYRRPKPKPEWDDSMVPTPIGRWDPDHAGELSPKRSPQRPPRARPSRSATPRAAKQAAAADHAAAPEELDARPKSANPRAASQQPRAPSPRKPRSAGAARPPPGGAGSPKKHRPPWDGRFVVDDAAAAKYGVAHFTPERPARGGPGADSPRVRNVHTAPAKAGAHSADLLESFPFAAPRPHPSIPAAPPMPAPYYVRTYQ